MEFDNEVRSKVKTKKVLLESVGDVSIQTSVPCLKPLHSPQPSPHPMHSPLPHTPAGARNSATQPPHPQPPPIPLAPTAHIQVPAPLIFHNGTGGAV